MGEKDWHLSGEADASKRPLNSALEVDMDFDTTGGWPARYGSVRYGSSPAIHKSGSLR